MSFLWHVQRKIKIWMLVPLLALSVSATIAQLRQNNLTMIEKRNAVVTADASGDAAKTQAALVDLQQYVSSHMNTDMGGKGVYLPHAYQEAYDAAVQQGLQNDKLGHTLYNQADAACQATFNRTYSFPAYTQCVAAKLADLSSHDPLNDVKAPSVDLFRYNFVSPLWSPDLAGIMLLVSIGLGLLLISKIIMAIALEVYVERTVRRQLP